MKIRQYFGVAFLLVGLLLASGIAALAESNYSGPVKLNQDVIVHGKTLLAGKYRVRWTTHSPEATVEFTQRKGVVLSTEGTYVDRGHKYKQNMYVTDTSANGTPRLVEVRFAGSSKVLTFN
jgi:predicted lysophospholipase L1 biosynthesis ABC-type transport system permease subunit